MSKTWEVYAIRYGRHDRPAQSNFLLPVQDPKEAMPLNYFLWLGGDPPAGHEIVVDTGFDAACAEKRGRTLHRSVGDSLRAMDCDPARVRDVVVTHLHYDHAGSIEIFSNAKIHIQDREMAFATGRHMCTACIRVPFEADHVVSMVRALFADKVQFHDGEGQVAPGVTVHRVGGHSDGLQVVRVETARGPVVIASDAAHYYANLQKRSPFPIVYNVGDMVQGWEIVEKLAGHPDRFIPGHNPIVSEIYPRASDKVDAFALHLAPSRSFVK